MSTYTQSLGLELITPGSQAGLWGNTTNNTFTLVDQAICGVTPLSFASASGSTITLTDYNGAEDEARSAVLNITGSAVGSNTVVVPNKQKTYLVRNNTGQDVVFQTASAGSTYTVGAGYSILIFCDGNNNVFTGIQSPSTGTLSVNGGGTGATTFTAGFIKSPGGTSALTSSSTVALGSEVSGTLPVANGGTGAVSLTSGALLVGNGTGTVASLSGGTAGYVATWNGSTWVSSAPASGAVSSVFGRTGAITAQSGDYSSYYYPYSSNPAGYLTSSSLSGYGSLSSVNNWTNTNNFVIAQEGQIHTNYLAGSYGWHLGEESGRAFVVYTDSGAGGAYMPYNFTTWQGRSDRRIKTDLEVIPNALNKVSQINGYTGRLISDETQTKRSFLIAQEVQAVLPEAVTVSPNREGDEFTDLLGMAYSDVVPLLVQAIKELKAEVDALKAAK